MTQNKIRTVLAVLVAVILLAGALYGLQHTHLVQAQLMGFQISDFGFWNEQSAVRNPQSAIGTATLSLIAPTDPITVGHTFTVTARVSDLDTPLAAFQFDLGYDPAVIRFVGMEASDGLRATGRSAVCPPHAQLAGGVRLACATAGDAPGITAPGDLAVLTFTALADGQSDLTLSAIKLPTDARPPTLIGDVTAQYASVTVGAACTAATLTTAFVAAEPAGSVKVAARVSNSGGAQIPAGLPVSFYADSALIGTAATTQALNLGASEVVTVTWAAETPGDHTITIVANDDGTGTGPVALCSAPAPVQQTVSILDVPLVESWNLMSSYVNPFTTDITVVQRPISGTYVVIQGFDQGAQSYYPDLPPEVNTLKEMEAEYGYWIKIVGSEQLAVSSQQSTVNSDQSADLAATLRVVGTKFAEDRPLELNAGWNLVSYLPRQPLAVQDALQSIAGQYFAVLSFEQGALSYYPHLDPSFNTLTTLDPLHGYWLKMTQADTLQYPVTGQGNSGELRRTQGNSSPQLALLRQAERKVGVRPTQSWVNFCGPALLADGKPAPEGTLVQVFDADGVPCGAGIVTVRGQYGLLACYGDDPTTDEDEGASPGDVLSFTIAGQPAPASREAVWTAHGDLQWTPLGRADLRQRWYLPLLLR